jgi:GNAT superfamily N-acetyltransferase
VRRLEAQAADEYLAFRPDTPRPKITERWRAGDTCFVVWHEGRIIAACWTSGRRAWSEFLGCEISLAPGDVYLYDAFTLPAHRGLGVAPVLCGHQLRDLHGQGYRRALRGTTPENQPALRAHGKTGFHPIAMLVSVRIGPWHKHYRQLLDGRAA